MTNNDHFQKFATGSNKGNRLILLCAPCSLGNEDLSSPGLKELDFHVEFVLEFLRKKCTVNRSVVPLELTLRSDASHMDSRTFSYRELHILPIFQFVPKPSIKLQSTLSTSPFCLLIRVPYCLPIR